jgi:hypothetical protein
MRPNPDGSFEVSPSETITITVEKTLPPYLALFGINAPELTLNLSGTWLNSTGRARDYRGSVQLDVPLREIANIGQPVFSMSGQFLSLLQEPLGQKVTLNGVTVDRRGNAFGVRDVATLGDAGCRCGLLRLGVRIAQYAVWRVFLVFVRSLWGCRLGRIYIPWFVGAVLSKSSQEELIADPHIDTARSGRARMRLLKLPIVSQLPAFLTAYQGQCCPWLWLCFLLFRIRLTFSKYRAQTPPR